LNYPVNRRILALFALGLLLCVVVVAVATASYQLGVSERSHQVQNLQQRVAELEAEVDLIGDDVGKLIE
jgi:CHASE3 domain sensor protein